MHTNLKDMISLSPIKDILDFIKNVKFYDKL